MGPGCINLDFPEINWYFLDVLVAMLGILRKHLGNDAIEFKWNVCPKCGDGFGVIVYYGIKGRLLKIPLERKCSGDHLIEYDTKGPNVCSVVNPFATRLFR